MNFRLILLAFTSLTFITTSCKHHKNAATTSVVDNTQKEVRYRIIVSFLSRGAGTSSEARANFLKYVDTHPNKPENISISWGREGETDYCLSLKELSKNEQTNFVNEIKKMNAGNNLVLISENAVCQHKSR